MNILIYKSTNHLTFSIYENELHIGGLFDNAGGVAVSNIAKVELNFNFTILLSITKIIINEHKFESTN